MLKWMLAGKMRGLGLWAFSVVPIHSVPLPEGAELKMELDTLAKIW